MIESIFYSYFELFLQNISNYRVDRKTMSINGIVFVKDDVILYN